MSATMAAPTNQAFMFGSMAPATTPSTDRLAPGGANPRLPRASFGDTTPSPSTSSSSSRVERPLIPRGNTFPGYGSSMPTAGGLNDAGPHVGQYYSGNAAASQQPPPRIDVTGQPFLGPTGHEAAVTHSSIARNDDGNMSYQPSSQLGGYPPQHGYPQQEYPPQAQHQSLMGQSFIPHHPSLNMGASYPSKRDLSANAPPPFWQPPGSFAPGMHPSQVDRFGNAVFDFDQSQQQQVYWGNQQGMYPPTEVFSRMPEPTPPPPPPSGPSSTAPAQAGPSYGSLPPQPSVSPPRSPKATAKKQPPRPPNAWILYRSETLAKMSRGERIPLLESVLVQQYGPPQFPPQDWPVPGESTEEDDSTGVAKAAKNVRKGKKTGKDINWYMWMLGLIRSPDGGMPQSDVSRIISNIWKIELPEQRIHYDSLSQIKKAEHLQKYPGYKFQPQKREDKMREKQEKLKEKEARRQEKEDRVHRNSLKRRKQRRSPSAELSDYHPYHVPGHPSHKRNSNGPEIVHERFELPMDAFRVPHGVFDAASFAPKMAEGLPNSSPSTRTSKPSTNSTANAQVPSPDETPPAPDATLPGELPMALGDGPRPVAWTDLQPVAPPPPQVAPSLFNPLASNYQPDQSTEGQYFFQPLTGSLPLDFMNGPEDNCGDDDELDNLVAGWAANASDINLDQFTANWDAHETANPMQVYGQGPIMDAIKMDWNNTFFGDDGNTFAQNELNNIFSISFAPDMNLPQGPPLAAQLPLSPVDTQRDGPQPQTQFPDWINRTSESGGNGSGQQSPFNANPGNMSASAFPLSVDPSTMGWSGEMANYDDMSSSGASTAVGAPMQQGTMMASQLDGRPNQGRTAGAYGQ